METISTKQGRYYHNVIKLAKESHIACTGMTDGLMGGMDHSIVTIKPNDFSHGAQRQLL